MDAAGEVHAKISTFEFQTLMNARLKIYAVKTATVETLLDRTHVRVLTVSQELTALHRLSVRWF